MKVFASFIQMSDVKGFFGLYEQQRSNLCFSKIDFEGIIELILNWININFEGIYIHECTEVFHHYVTVSIKLFQKSHECETVQ